ncbi:SAM-dependent methyltransferase [Parabacteroides sp. FAFU027]|uniref:SAM-dependent methyltransferase n=1 Tax=Parabacteroides sp. FAFU027 TaxID=2922715 RepID=UPI001FAF5BC8|nr:SAM-dependent methyltransferase [Parabacteroides sp. FAFU027]
MQPSLFLIPVTLGDTPLENVLPEQNKAIIKQISYFIVENIRTARRFLKKALPEIEIESLTFFELNKHTSPNDIAGFLEPMKKGNHVGVISEAGCPAIADPGADVVAIAQSNKYHVVPLVGPSSILLSLMASGFNGQSFAFLGYLPIDAGARTKALKQMEQRIYSEHQTQIFIETPYRNHKLIEELIKNCRPQSKLCIAANVTCDNEFIQTKAISEWKGKIPDLAKIPAIFLLYK